MAANRLAFMSLIVIAMVAGLSGCTHKSPSAFTPSSDKGRAALDAALKSWMDGQQPGTVAGTSKPVVQVADSDWSDGQKLTSYEIVKDEPPTGPGPRVFTVRLTTADGKAREVKYMIVGIDPLLIYRDIDYDKLSGMSK
jgi:predicted small lipoprotein YifL